MEIENQIAEVQNEKLKAEENLNTIQIEKYRLKKELVEITENERKAKFIFSKLKIQENILTRQFWAQKR